MPTALKAKLSFQVKGEPVCCSLAKISGASPSKPLVTASTCYAENGPTRMKL